MVSQFDEAEEWIRKAYPQLNDQIYLDYAAAVPFPKELIQEYAERLISNESRVLLGNPHSQHSLSASSTLALLNRARSRVLAFLQASPSEYDVIFTSNATAAVRLVAEAFPWSSKDNLSTQESLKTAWKRSKFHRLLQNHTSIVGIRGIAEQYDVEQVVLGEEKVKQWLGQPAEHEDILDTSQCSRTFHLFAYPAQCNFSGRRYPLDWIQAVQNRSSETERWCVLLDAASYLSTAQISLSANPADFLCLSFYKIFGFPTSVGALVLKKDMARYLRKRYFGGGTVMALATHENWIAYRSELHQKFEDGTPGYLEIVGLLAAFDYYERHSVISYESIQERTHRLFLELYQRLSHLKHSNGTAICKFYVDTSHVEDRASQGPILNLNIRTNQLKLVSPSSVAQLASLNQIHLRVGAFCNPGAHQYYLQISDDEIKRLHEQDVHVCWSDKDIVDCKVYGSIRVSLGCASVLSHVTQFVSFIETYFRQSEQTMDDILTSQVTGHRGRVIRLAIYPIKSCQAFYVEESTWPVQPWGFKFDRELSIVDTASGRTLSQKQYPRLCLIKPKIYRSTKRLVISAPDKNDLELHLSDDMGDDAQIIRICGRTAKGCYLKDQLVHKWFSDVLGVDCMLVHNLKQNRTFSNESPFLLTNQSSLDRINQDFPKRPFEMDSFRPNIVVDGDFKPFSEETWKYVKIGSLMFEVLGKCKRCFNIAVNQTTSVRDTRLYNALARLRKTDGVYFGIHVRPLVDLEDSPICSVSDDVQVISSN